MRTTSPTSSRGRRAPAHSLVAAALFVVAVLCLPAASSAFQQQQQQRPSFDVSVARVRVDVIVTADGRFVDDLRPEDFVLKEDGDEQPILSVQLVDLMPAGVDEDEEGAYAAMMRAPAAVELTPAGGADNPFDLAAVVYVVNGLGVGCRGVSRFARTWARSLEGIEEVSVPHSVYLIDFLGYMHELASYTRDADQLRKAAESIRGKPLFSDEIDPVYEANYGGMCFGTPIGTIAPERTFELLAAVTDSLANRTGRKALVWISRDISMAAQNVRRGDTVDAFDIQRADKVAEAFERSANAAGVSVYGFDPDMVTWHTYMGGVRTNRGPAERILNDPFAGSFSASSNYLSRVSRNTGGRPFIRWGNIPKALAQVQRETARFYLVTYAPPDPPEDGDYHEIEVEVLRRGVDVRARDGYFDVSDADRRARAETGRQILAEPSPLFQMVGG